MDDKLFVSNGRVNTLSTYKNIFLLSLDFAANSSRWQLNDFKLSVGQATAINIFIIIIMMA